uniref:Putative galacturonosyltransferase 3 isoform X1 n=1 Tax=Rhizophora mucronata TaxID=61149 RepID=A0A2P2KMV4_RHIMU
MGESKWERPFGSSFQFPFLLFISTSLSLVAVASSDLTLHRELEAYRPLHHCQGQGCTESKPEQDVSSVAGLGSHPIDKDIDIIAAYSDTSGTVRLSRVNMKDLSPSWVLENPVNAGHEQKKASQVTFLLNLTSSLYVLLSQQALPGVFLWSSGHYQRRSCLLHI